MSPRPRNPNALLPNGIKALALPTGVYWERTGRGRWLLKRTLPETRKVTYSRLGGPEMTLREIWDAYELAVKPPPATTLADLIGEFQRSRIWAGLSQNTQRDYQCCADAIQKQHTTAGVPVGVTRLIDWTPGAVRKYVDKRGEHSVSRANHELRFLRRLFAWGYERDILSSNPGLGVKTLPEPPRQRYVADAEYDAFLAFAGPRAPYLVPVAELSYLCRLRLSEVCDLRRADFQSPAQVSEINPLPGFPIYKMARSGVSESIAYPALLQGATTPATRRTIPSPASGPGRSGQTARGRRGSGSASADF